MAFDEEDETQDIAQNTGQEQTQGVNLDGEQASSPAPSPQGIGDAARGAFNTLDSGMANGINRALETVKRAIQYNRQKHGLGDGASDGEVQAQPFDRFAMHEPSQNIEDRRGESYGIKFKNERGDVDISNIGNPVAPMRAMPYGATRKPALGFDDGGPVEDDEEELTNAMTTGGIPAQVGAGMEAEGAGAVGMAQQEPGDKNPFPVGQHIRGALQGGAQRILAYLQGADAADPKQVQALEQSVDPDGSMRAEQRKLAAVAAAPTEDEQAKVIQHYRKHYDTYRAGAIGALDSGDLAKAAEYATNGSTNTLTGTSMRFAPTNGGVTATVIDSNGSPVSSNAMTTDQFKKWLTDDAGQYDHVQERGHQASVQSLIRGPARGATTAQDQQNPQVGARQQEWQRANPGADPPNEDSGAARVINRGESPVAQRGFQNQGRGDNTLRPGANRSPYGPPDPGRRDIHQDDNPLQARARERFPSVGEESQRQDWVTAQEQQEETNKLNRTKAESPYGVAQEKTKAVLGGAETRARATLGAAETRAGGLRDVAQIRADAYGAATDAKSQSRVQEARIKLSGELAKIAQQNARTAVGAQANIAVQAMKNLQSGVAVPKNIQNIINNITQEEGSSITQQAAPQQQQAPQPQAPQGGQGSRPNAPQPAGGFRPGPGWQLNKARQQYRDPQGKIYDMSGKPVGE